MPALTELDIANMALLAINAGGTITDFAEQSRDAQVVNQYYTQARDDALGQAHWNFARKTAVLSLLKSAPGTPEFVGTPSTTWTSDYPAPPWAYEYQKPDDCLVMRYVI